MTENYYTDWVECSCSTHAVSVSHYVDPAGRYEDDEVYISIWGAVETNDDSWRQRIRRAWHALRGNVHLDQVILHPAEAVKLRDAIDNTLAIVAHGRLTIADSWPNAPEKNDE